MSLFHALLLAATQAVVPPPVPAAPPPVSQNASPATPQIVTPPKPPVVPPSTDPASSHFLTDTGILLVTIKPDSVADYEMVIRTLQEALANEKDPIRVAAAKGWRVFRASENDAKGNPIFIHLMLPTVTGFDYRPSLLIDELIKDLAPDLLSRYQDAFAAPPTRLNLTEFANMSVAPLPLPPPPETKKPPGG
ncbi:MAG: hypothetical protein ABI039_01745 [Vicinamibacterales bacterium]